MEESQSRSMFQSQSATSIEALYGVPNGAGSATSLLRQKQAEYNKSIGLGEKNRMSRSASSPGRPQRPSSRSHGRQPSQSQAEGRLQPSSASRQRGASGGPSQSQRRQSLTSERYLQTSDLYDESEPRTPGSISPNASRISIAASALDQTALPMASMLSVRDMAAMDVGRESYEAEFESRRGGVGGATVARNQLRSEALSLKGELNESRDEARRLRHRLSQLEGDVQGKVQWMLQWERQTASSSSDAGPAGVSFSAWKQFIDRATMESQKTQKCFHVSVSDSRQSLDEARAKCDRLRDESTTAAEELREEEELSAKDLAENVRLASLLRRRDSQGPQRPKPIAGRAANVMQLELAIRERELLQLRAEQDEQAQHRAALLSELDEERRRLSEMPVQRMKKSIQRLQEERDQLEQYTRNFQATAVQKDHEDANNKQQALEKLNIERLGARERLAHSEHEVKAAQASLEGGRLALKNTEDEEDRRRQRNKDIARAAREQGKLEYERRYRRNVDFARQKDSEMQRELEEEYNAIRIQSAYRGNLVRRAKRR